jgi:predicted DNA-binding transcriptional regulator AlpA
MKSSNRTSRRTIPEFLPRYSKKVITRHQLKRALSKEVLDIHGVAELLGIKRSSVNTLISKPEFNFPEPIYETSGEQRHPVRLWYRRDVEQWQQERNLRSKSPNC